ncbi:MAG: ATP-binding protein, partial [Desulfobacterota bacterium]|nr:ATP-binding protein [Thermodesulfobacteriota bacterium]
QAIMGQMAAGIVHEVKNPLASISGSIQMLREELKEDGSGDRLLNLISREVDKLDTLLHDFLTFARPSQQAEQRVDLADLIPGTLELIRKTKGVSPGIRWEIDLERGLYLRIPPGEFSQILWNILINAVQAVPQEGLIRVGGRRLTEGRFAGGLEVQVEDNGPGIPTENLEKIFTPFFTTKEKGVGLGLSIVQKIVAQNGGLLRVRNRAEGGAQVVLVFPDPEKGR